MTDRIIELTGVVDRGIALAGAVENWALSPDTGIANRICMDSGGVVTFAETLDIDNLHAGNFTIEGWWKITVDAGGLMAMLTKAPSNLIAGWALYYNDNFNKFNFNMFATGPGDIVAVLSTDNEIVANAWYHIAVTYEVATRAGRMWLNGIEDSAFNDTTASAFNDDSANDLLIGGDGLYAFGAPLDGCYQWINITNTLKYTANFTPPAKNVKPSITDSLFNVPNREGTGSVAYDIVEDTVGAISGGAAWVIPPDTGVSNEILMNAGGNVTFLSPLSIDNLYVSDFTIEGWFKFDSLGNVTSQLLHKGDTIGITVGWTLGFIGFGLDFVAFEYQVTSNSADQVSVRASNGSIVVDTWYHIAVTYDESAKAMRMWLNGIEDSFDTDTSANTFQDDSPHDLIVGGDIGSSSAFDGRYQWLNITDTLKYTTNFTPPSRITKPSTTDSIFSVSNKEGTGSVVYDDVGDYEGAFGGNVAWDEVPLNITAFWPLSELEGNNRVDAVGSLDVTEVTATVPDGTDATFPVHALFDATGRLQTVSTSPGLDPDNGSPLSIAYWIKPVVNNQNAYATSFGSGGVNYIGNTGHQSSTKAHMTMNHSPFASPWITTALSTETLSNGTWYLIGHVFDPDNNRIRISVNGGAFNDTAFTVGNETNNVRVFFGGTDHASFFLLEAGLAHIMWFKHYVLTLADLQWVYNSGVPRDTSEITG